MLFQKYRPRGQTLEAYMTGCLKLRSILLVVEGSPTAAESCLKKRLYRPASINAHSNGHSIMDPWERDI